MKSLLPIFILLIAVTACHGQEPDTLDALSYSNSGAHKVQDGDYYGALVDVEKSIAKNPKWALAYDIRGLIKEHTGDIQGALTDFTKAIQFYSPINMDTNSMTGIDIDAATAYNNRGRIEVLIQDYKAAKSDFSMAIKIFSSPEAYYGRGRSEIMLGEKDSGCEDLRKAMEQGHKSAENVIKTYCR